ncbi:ribose transport system permease protein [Faunimonas pinastri]|uniref:Ribose transport system permease protein n=1 Tax=Faunimonas pinastri TaxID=1855383 RepID=A0A1H9IJ59_9HYPH|nr:sugar ABC transporter permease [Faunimonas pinastri]SEQ74579.1 ribose transport system permease protein [Faunimonas pinastri]
MSSNNLDVARPADPSPLPSGSASVGSASVGNPFQTFRHSPIFFPLIGLVAVIVIMIFASGSFFSVANLTNVMRQVSINAIVAVGMTFVILTGGIDLSVGAVMALAGTIAAGMMVHGFEPVLALVVGLGVGFGFGLFNGLLVAYARMPPIIVTLATMGVARGLALMYSGGYPISGLPKWMRFFGNGAVWGVQTPIIITLVVYLVAWVVLERAPFGRYVYAIGGNETATRLSGIKVGRAKLIVYAVSGLTAAIAAIVLTSRLMSGQPNAGIGFELDAIAAVVLGGTAIAGGRGSVIGTLIGALLLGVLNNGLNMMGLDPYVQNVIKGGIILLAIFIGRERRA